MLALLAPKRPCPWCGVAMAVPPAMPDADLARHLESRCDACNGGVRAHATWRAFLLFVAVYACVSNVALWCLYRAWCAWRDNAPIGGAWTTHAAWTAVALGGFVAITLLAQRYLVGVSALVRGKPPRRQVDW